MTKDEMIELAKQSGWEYAHGESGFEPLWAFANLVAEKEREAVANWMMNKGFSTGHGESTKDLLDELEWQIAEREREACANICETLELPEWPDKVRQPLAQAIRARGQE